MLIPLSYTLRSLFVRKSATLLTVFGIGATVAVLAGVLALRAGFTSLFSSSGRDDIAVFIRQGASSEGESGITRETCDRIIKTLPQIAREGGPEGTPLAAMECYLAVRRQKADGSGETNVPLRGVQPASFAIQGDALRIIAGRKLTPGSDEVIVGQKLVDRIANSRLDDVVQVNTTPFRVVGVFACDGPSESEIWGDVERMMAALERPVANRVVAQLALDCQGDAFAAFAKQLTESADYKELLVMAKTERVYLAEMAGPLGTTLWYVSAVLSVIMGLAAIFTATNTMLSAVASRTHEIGILLSIGFRPLPIFLSFLFEALLLGLVGGAVGCLMALPVNGIETGTTNFATFTEVAFAFRVTPEVLWSAIRFALILGLLGGAIPAWKAARLAPTEALRRR
ncbi:MAG: ABC transporter permease [Planctomycetes bacterium]|nr:ABC transporter permease [Planctomycetota bacterium]